MSLMDIFAGFRGTDKPAVTPTPPANNQDVNATVPNANTPKSDGSLAAIPKAAEGDKSPLAGYTDLWKTTDKDGKPISWDMTLNADPKKLLDAAGKLDFVKSIDPSVLENAAKGDKDALSKLVNTAGQLGWANAASATAAIVQDALNKQATKFRDEVFPELMRRQQVSQNLSSDKSTADVFNNEAVRPLITQLESQLAIKYPNENAAQITARAKDFMLELGTLAVTASGKQIVDTSSSSSSSSPMTKKDTDWEKFFGVDTPS